MMTDATDQTQLPAGTTVESADGQKLGSIKEIQLNHYLVEKGLIFKHDLYVPKGAVTNYDGSTAWLSLSKDQIDAAGWDQPPMADAPPGMAAEALPDNPVEINPLTTNTTPLRDDTLGVEPGSGVTDVAPGASGAAAGSVVPPAPPTRIPSNAQNPGSPSVRVAPGEARRELNEEVFSGEAADKAADSGESQLPV